MFFKGTRLKVTTIEAIKMASPISNTMNKRLKSIETSAFKTIDKHCKGMGCNETEAALSVAYITLTMIKNLDSVAGTDVTEHDQVMSKLATTLVLVWKVDTHVSIDKVIAVLIAFYNQLIKGNRITGEESLAALDKIYDVVDIVNQQP